MRAWRRPRRSGSRRRPRSSSAWLTARARGSTPGGSRRARDRDDLVPAHDERPRLAVGARDLRVDEHVLHLLAPPGEPIARAPRAHLEPGERRLDRPRRPSATRRGADRALLEPEPVVLAHRLDAAAEVDALRAGRRGEQLGERRAAAGGAPRARAGGSRRRPGGAAQQRQDLVADEAALRVRVRGVAAEREARGGSTPRSPRARAGAAGGRRRPRGAARSRSRGRARRAGRGRSRPGRTRCGPWRAAGRRRTVAERRAARPRSPCAGAARRPRRRAARGRSARPRRTPRRAGRGSRAAPRRGSRARRARARGRSSPAPPETRQATSPPGGISSWRRMCVLDALEDVHPTPGIQPGARRVPGQATAAARTSAPRAARESAHGRDQATVRDRRASRSTRRRRSPARSRGGRRGDGRHRLEQLPAERAHPALRVAAVPHLRGDPDLLDLHRRGVHAEASALNRIVPPSRQSQERPSSICIRVRQRKPAGSRRERVDPELLLVRGGAGGEQQVEVVARRRAQAASPRPGGSSIT